MRLCAGGLVESGGGVPAGGACAEAPANFKAERQECTLAGGLLPEAHRIDDDPPVVRVLLSCGI